MQLPQMKMYTCRYKTIGIKLPTLNLDWSKSYTLFHIGSSGRRHIPSLQRITPFWRVSSRSGAAGSSQSKTLSSHLLNKYTVHSNFSHLSYSSRHNLQEIIITLYQKKPKKSCVSSLAVYTQKNLQYQQPQTLLTTIVWLPS